MNACLGGNEKEYVVGSRFPGGILFFCAGLEIQQR